MRIRRFSRIWELLPAVFLASAPLSGCATHYRFRGNPDALVQYKYATLSVAEIEDNGDRYRAKFAFHNGFSRSVIFLEKDISCYRGGGAGKAAALEAEEIFTVAPAATREIELECRFRGAGSGEYRIVIQTLYERPRGEDSDLGRVMATDLEWQSGRLH